MKQWKLILVTLLAVLMVCVCTSAMAEVCGECEQRSSVKAGTCTTEGTLTIYDCKNKDCDNYDNVYYTGSTGIDPDNHKDLTTVARVEATCTKDGVKGHQRCACGAYLDLAGNVISAADVVIKADHTWKVTETVKATCTEKGHVTSVCTVEGCTKTKTETLKATGHALQFKKKEAADCGNDGYDLYVCQNKGCDYSEKLHTVPATGEHDWNLSNKKAPTCGEEGFKSYTCTVCGETKKDIIDATGEHSWKKSNIVAPKCEAEGYDKYSCENCDATKKENIVPATGHHYDRYYGWVKMPTCIEDGSANYICDECGGIEVRTVAKDASYHDYSKYVAAKDPTCVEAGYTNHWECTICGGKNVDYKVVEDKDAHKTDLINKKKPTCTEDGYSAHYVCKLCDWVGDTYKVLEAPGHVWQNWSIPKEATCTETGILHQGCANCDAEQDVVIEKKAHQEIIDPNLSWEATCTEDGKNFWVCETCDEAIREEILPKAEHEMRVDVIYKPTCETEGYELWVCTKCGYEQERRSVPALGHAWKYITTVAPTCTAKGYDWYVCENDNCKYNAGHADNFTDMIAHKYDILFQEKKAATCEEAAWQIWRCKCGAKDTKKIIKDATGHNYKLVANTPASCQAEGLQFFECYNAGCEKPAKSEKIAVLPHNYAPSKWQVIVEPKCGEYGRKMNVCTMCKGEPIYEDVPALEHKYGDPIAYTGQAPTCTESGEGAKYCEYCNHAVTVVLDPIGHNLKETEVVPATCTGNGLKKVTCKNKCGLTKYELIPAFGHQNLEEVSKTDATCTEAGEIVKKCADCGTTVPEVIPATGHQHTKEEIVKAPTCTEAGSNQVVCTDCNTVIETKEVAAKGHGATKEVADKAATCTEAGSINVICTVCGDVLETKEVAALGHGATKEEAVKAATCTEAGSVNVICTVCGETLETKEVAALGHELDEGVVTAPTCTEDGYTTYACTRCDYTEVKDETKATGHVDTKEVETLAPTCTEAGNIDVVCACGEVVESKAVEALGHDMVAGEVTAPTCTEKGYTTYECSRCDATEIKDETEALGHTYEWVMDAVVASPAAPGENWYQCSVCEDIADIEYVKYTKYYYENTLTSFGPTTEELLGEGDWYRVTPIDLSVDGIYTFDLIASNAYVVGTVTITVSEGVMTVSYDVNANHIEVLEEALVLYASKADLAEGKGVTVAFGEEINLAETFGEDSKVLVSLMLIGTYDAAGYGVYGFEADAEEIADLLAIVD